VLRKRKVRLYSGVLLCCLIFVARCSAQEIAPKVLPQATLQKLQKLLAAPELADARVGVSIMALGKVKDANEFPSRAYANKIQPILFEQDGQKRFTPASNMKLFTAALALKVIGREGLFTHVVASAPSEKGIVRGKLMLLGGGDPSLDVAGLKELARKVRASGVRQIEGVETGAVFRAENLGGRYPDGWTMDDALWYYGPEVSALAFHRNQIDVVVTGGARRGAAPRIQLENVPHARAAINLETRITTGGAALADVDPEDSFRVERRLAGDRKVVLSGEVAPNQKVAIGLAVPDPQNWARLVFTSELKKAGVRIVPAKRSGAESKAKSGRVIATLASPSPGILLRKFLKSSDNLYGEMLLRGAADVAPLETQ